MEFREKPMQNLIRIKEKEICKNVQALLLARRLRGDLDAYPPFLWK